MKDFDDKNPTDSDDPKAKASKYKSMTKKPGQSFAADTTKAPSPTNPIMVEKKDGSIGRWGNDLPNNTPTKTIPAKPTLSDKANGNDNTYNATRDQQTRKKDLPMLKPSFKY